MLYPAALSFAVSYFMSDYMLSQLCTHVVLSLNVDWSECMLSTLCPLYVSRSV